MTRSERRQLERQQAKQSNKIEVNVATTLEQAIHHADVNGVTQFGYEGIFYLKVSNEWIANDIIPELLELPQYNTIYTEYSKKEGVQIAKDILLAIFTANMGEGNEYDLSYMG